MRSTDLSIATGVCRHCGWPETDPYEEVSRHTTSEGLIVYTRCVCGLLHVRRQAPGEARTPIIARSQQAAVPPSRGQQQ